MKTTFQVAAGIVLATAILWVGRLMVVNATMQSLTEHVAASTEKMRKEHLEAARQFRLKEEARRLERQQEEAEKAQRIREQEKAACVVITADGRELHCAPKRPVRY